MESFKSLVENAVEGIFRTSPDGRYLYANPSLARIYGYESAEELKHSVTNIVSQLYVDNSRRAQFIAQIHAKGEVRDFISEIWRKDKTKIWISENARETRDEKGEMLCYEGFVTDVTDQMMMVERLRRSERMEALGQLSAGVAHDFNNMLGAIRGYAEMLGGDHALSAQAKSYAETILKASDRATELTKKLLAFSRRDERKMKICEMNKLVEEVANLLKRSVGRDIEIEVSLKAERCAALCDAGQLSNAILNLAVNARDAMPSGGKLSISTENVKLDTPFRWCRPNEFRAGEFIAITVRDSGTGFEINGRERIFEPFFTTKEKGTGMGLASVYATVRNHCGTIDVASEKGVGSVFQLFLPLDVKTAEVQARGAESWTSPGSEMVRGSGKLLLADDNELNLSFMAEMLNGLGYEVIRCEDGKQAFERYKESWRDFDLSVLDIDMPGLSGIETFKAMRAINPRAKAIFVTGLSDISKSSEATTLSDTALLRKPFDPRELSRRVASAIKEG